jgi:FKBP-type peptidyl-prolyl cis-trans isomerase FklB
MFTLTTTRAFAADASTLTSDGARQSYSAGYHAVTRLKEQGREPDLAAILSGVLDGLAGTPRLGPDEMRALLQSAAQEPRSQGVRDELTPIGAAEAFFAANASKPGVKTLQSGLQFRVLQAGSGKKPRPGDRVVVHYRGSLLDGREIDNTFASDQPETYGVDEVMPGWREALLLMPEGAEWELYIPSRLAYGKRGPLENQALVYRIKLLSVIPHHTTPEGEASGAPRE